MYYDEGEGWEERAEIKAQKEKALLKREAAQKSMENLKELGTCVFLFGILILLFCVFAYIMP